MTEQLVIELVKVGGLIIAASVPSLAALCISKSRQRKDRLERELKQALEDILFLLRVEAEHGRRSREETGSSNLKLVRTTVHCAEHLSWSGKNSQYRVMKKLEELNR